MTTHHGNLELSDKLREGYCSHSSSLFVGPGNAKHSRSPVLWECPEIFGCPKNINFKLDAQTPIWDFPWTACSPLRLKYEWTSGCITWKFHPKKGREIEFFFNQSKDMLSFRLHKCHFSNQEWYYGIHKMSTIQFLFSTIEEYYLLRIDGDFFK